MKHALPSFRSIPAMWWSRLFSMRLPGARETSGHSRRDSEPSLEDILTEDPPRLFQSAIYIVAVLLVILIAIASWFKVDIVVSGSGRLAADSPTIVIQPMQLSIIREILVKPGDTIPKGDIVARLDPTFTQADKAVLLEQQSSIKAQIARLDAELDDRPLQLDSDALETRLQLNLFTQRQSQFAARLGAFDEDIKRLEAAISTTENNLASLVQQLEITREVESMRSQLFRVRVGSKLNHLDSQVTRMRAEREHQDSANRLVELRHTHRQRQAERQAFVAEWRRLLLEDLVKARASASTAAESLVKAARLNDLVALVAPADGIVLEVAKRSVGSVLQGGEPLVTMVPTTAALIAEVAIDSADVGYTKIGDEVALKVDAFPYQRHGLLKGRVRSIGAESYAPTSSSAPVPAFGSSMTGAIHRAQVELTDTALHALPDDTRLIPGMSLTAEVKVGSRSVISYFLYPITRGFSESIREP